MKITKVLSCVLLSLVCGGTFGATYYVDATSGNDSYGGTQASASGGNGPWQSLSRVATASLAPGDSVLLKCGEKWREPLVVPASGTPSSPIRIASYGSCSASTYPLIDGSLAVPAGNWRPYSGNIYRAALPISLMGNGTFDQGVGGWRKWSQSGSASISDGTDCAPAGTRCLRFAAAPGTSSSILSSPGFALDPLSYQIGFRVKAPAGVSLRVVIRRDAGPWDSAGFDRMISGTGAWQTYSYSFRGAAAVSSARLDFEVPPGQAISVDDVSLTGVVGTPQQLLVDGMQLEPAHHPNQGYDPARPQSSYLRAAADSDQVLVNGANVSTYVTTGADLRLPSGVSLTPGLDLRIRTASWMIDERKIAGISGNRLTLDAPTTYPLKTGWGYFLSGALWMLDSPGEWHYDQTANAIYLWMPDGGAPASRVSLALLPVGIDASNRSNVVIDSIAVRRVGVGVRIASGNGVTVRNVQITDTTNEGIDASGTVNSTLESNSIVRAGRDAVSGLSRVTWRLADGLRVVSNYISEAGVRVANGGVVSLPRQIAGAIYPGTRAYVYGNRVIYSGYNAIWPRADSTVEHNYVENACLVLDDCAGVYLGSANNTVVRDNLIVHVIGAADGKPDSQSHSQGQGIYLDDLSTGVLVINNTVYDADHGIHLHNAYNNRLEANRLYGNRVHQLWMQEESRKLRADGDIYGNTITGNVMVPTTPDPSILQWTPYTSTWDFATYSANVYSGLLAPQIVHESWGNGSALYTFPEWQAARTSAGVPRNLDPGGRQVTLTGFATYRMGNASVIPNGNLRSGLTGWRVWNQLAPLGTLSLVSCAVGPCAQYTAGASVGIVSSPNFSVVKEQWYRVSFDLATGTANQEVRWAVRRGGGGTNSYELLMGSEQKIYGTTAWTRYSYIFKASKTVNANDPVTLDLGARLDFQGGDVAGQRFWVANAEMVPVSPVGAALRTQIIVNPAMTSQLVNCPDTGADLVFCPKYMRFTDATPISWPYTLPALGSEIIYSRGDTLADADGDGIADIQDACPATPAGKQVNSRGCAIGQ